MLALLLSLLSLVAPPTPPTISPADAAQHVGEFVMVQGTVDQVSVTTRNGTFLDFGGRYPNYTFTAVIFASKRWEFANVNVKAYEGKTVRVLGVVQLYRGKPEIILNEPGQLRASW